MIKKKYKATVKNGILEMKENDIFQKELLGYEGKEVVITVGPKDHPGRSEGQNSYYWAVPIRMLSEQTGHSDDEIHELMKCRFLKEHFDLTINNEDGTHKIERYTIVKSTASLDTVGWEDYMSKIRQFATEKFQLYIPKPNECDYEY